jgi:hypothetical protein
MGVSRLGLDVSAGQLDRATAALREADDSLSVDIPQEMLQLANRLATLAQRRILEEPTHGVKQTGLRATIAAGVQVEPTPEGAHISTSVPKSNEAELPRGTDDPIRGWMHPVFGHMDRWVRQHDSFSWFMDSMQTGQDDGERALQNLLEDAARRINAEVA